MKQVLLLTGLLALALLAGCRQPEATPAAGAGLEIALSIAPEPLATGAAEVTVTVNQNGQPVPIGIVSLRGDMTHAGMIPVIRENITLADGRAVVPFEWTMGGDWFIEVTVTLPDGTSARQTFDYAVTGS
ncbi:MAG: FixH family protein [Anaerolineae bacterium]|nr:FixH family protein [Anaerolineae bacterium]